MKSVVIDTNAYSAFKRGEIDAIDVVTIAEVIVFTPTVLGELLGGFSLGKRGQQNIEELNVFLADPKVLFLTINAQTAEEYSKIYKQLRQKGTPIPANDLWIAAMAKQLEMALFTYDAHFSRIEGLKIVQKATDF
jgi:predicted nucleic acid-binding protein